jgi:hypothetical protein
VSGMCFIETPGPEPGQIVCREIRPVFINLRVVNGRCEIGLTWRLGIRRKRNETKMERGAE